MPPAPHPHPPSSHALLASKILGILQCTHAAFGSFLAGLLHPNPALRVRAQDLLRHPFLARQAQVPEPTPEGVRFSADPIFRFPPGTLKRSSHAGDSSSGHHAKTPAQPQQSAPKERSVPRNSTKPRRPAKRKSNGTTAPGPTERRKSDVSLPTPVPVQPAAKRTPPRDGGGFFSLRPASAGGSALPATPLKIEADLAFDDTVLLPGDADVAERPHTAEHYAAASPEAALAQARQSALSSTARPMASQAKAPKLHARRITLASSSATAVARVRRRASLSPAREGETLLVLQDSDDEAARVTPRRVTPRGMFKAGRQPLRNNTSSVTGASPTLRAGRLLDPPADDLLDADLEDGDILTL
jgi:hypothetical protein